MRQIIRKLEVRFSLLFIQSQSFTSGSTGLVFGVYRLVDLRLNADILVSFPYISSLESLIMHVKFLKHILTFGTEFDRFSDLRLLKSQFVTTAQ